MKPISSALIAGLLAVALLAAGCGSSGRVLEDSAPVTAPSTTTTTSTTVPVVPVSTCAETAAPAAGVTQLAKPNAAGLAYSASPGGAAVGHLKEQWGGPSTRPVVDLQNGWVEVRLNTRPNGSLAWVPLQNVTLSTTPYRIVVSVCQRSLTLYQGADVVYTSPVGVGQARWPTPLGSTFVDAIVNTPARQQYIYGPTVLILGTHSNVFTEFDGGDGTVGIHGYPSDPGSTRGVASSHGCVRSSPATISAIKVVPVGTPVDVVA